MRANEVRSAFLEYFREKSHAVLPSSSVIPHGDKTLLFTNAGMNQFKDYFTGKKSPQVPRATTAQKCIRAGGKHNDLDNVGYTARHLTFFEMMGNFSFGDYFKEDAVSFAWEFVTRRLAIPAARLWVTVFREDDEAAKIWKRVAGIPDSRLARLGEKDNFWSMGDVGPCGPCSEILYDRGDAFGPLDIENGERLFEIWNLVFMQFEQKADGTRSALPRPSIDTGMGLERAAMVLQGTASVFETDGFRPIVRKVEELSGVAYDPGAAGVVHRVLADHVRCLVFAFADGAEPSNEGRGYVLRRILRRAARYARKIAPSESLLHRLVDSVVGEMGAAYPEIQARREYITRVIRGEEERFGETLDKGIELFDQAVAKLRARGERTIPGNEVFTLYDTFGFPVDLVEKMAGETDFAVDMPGFERLLEEQKTRSRGASKFRAVDAPLGEFRIEGMPPTRFLGYSSTRERAKILGASEEGGIWRVILDSTPFYGESGGQVGDAGTLEGADFRIEVEDTKRVDGRFLHCGRLVAGSADAVREGVEVEAVVDGPRRAAIARNHTATHLLHAALRRIVGAHVHQKGSLVEPARLRFDATHFSAFKPEELEVAEALVLAEILRNTPVETSETTPEEASRLGAMALFGEKYGDRVRLVRIGDFSLELCGGTHVARTGELGPFQISGEGSVSAGVRRIEALSGEGARAWHRRNQEVLDRLSRLLKVPEDQIHGRVERLLEAEREQKSKPRASVVPQAESGDDVRRESLGPVRFVSATLPGADMRALREAYDRFKMEAPETVVVLFGLAEGKAQVLVGVGAALAAKGWDARTILQAGAGRLGARGGGRAEMAQAGGAGGAEALQSALEDMRAAILAHATRA